ncbi:probable inactive purple acid phosphatase 16 [Humulus lupulus]|uniref:probable inactive purple acid phosphatase 16 n=1 Tax=Humulus lupulus TaxID=3486 RepID=UPI002B4078A6|nr:probable inactive purple acid phosphatase 16 [Humulus lupulus]
MTKLRTLSIIIFSYTCLSLYFQLISTVRFNDGASRHDHHRPQTVVSSSSLRTKPEKTVVLEAGGAFKIALFADLHFGENSWSDWAPLQDVASIEVMSNILGYENPDFVVYLGDVITANNIGIENASLYWDQAISPTRAKGVPWATVFGNHDDAPFEWPIEWFSPPGVPQLLCPPTNSTTSCPGREECSFKGTSRVELMRKEVEKNNNVLSHSKSGPKELWPSVSNYVIQLSSSEDPQSPLAFFYVLDSGGGSYPQIISSAQIEWFKSTTQNINPSSRVPEIIFWHIPSEAYEKVAPNSTIQKPCVGSINYERVASQQVETGMMKLLVERPSVKAVFSGHNHGLDWCCPYSQLWLCFARHSGYGGYGGEWAKGSRILQITPHPFSIKSWIRMEDGHVHSQVVLFNRSST